MYVDDGTHGMYVNGWQEYNGRLLVIGLGNTQSKKAKWKLLVPGGSLIYPLPPKQLASGHITGYLIDQYSQPHPPIIV